MKKGKRFIACLLSLVLVFTAMELSPLAGTEVQATTNKVTVAGSKMELWVGDEQLVATDVAGEFDQVFKSMYNRYYAVLVVKSDYEVWGVLNQDNCVEALAIQPTCSNEITFDGIRIKGAGDFSLWASKKDTGNGAVMGERQLTVTLNAYDAGGEPWNGYAIYTSFFADEDGGNPSDKIHIDISDGAMITDEAEGVTTSSRVQVNGSIRTTSFCVSDVLNLDFGSEEAFLAEPAFEFNYQQSTNNEWDQDSYYEIEIDGAQVNAYIESDFLGTASTNKFRSLWVYNEAELKVIPSGANVSSTIMSALDYMRVMTGGVINVAFEPSVDIWSIPSAKSSYYTATGAIKEIEQEGRIQDAVTTVDCVLDTEDEDYNAETNPTPNADREGRYTFTKDAHSYTLKSTCKSLEVIDIGAPIVNGSFKIEAGSGLLNEQGSFWAERGTKVKFTLVPDPGYQYKAGTFTANDGPINDNVLFQATSDPGVYIYTMGKNAVYMKCEFEAATDEVNVDADGVDGGSIDMGENELNGSMEFNVEDAGTLSSGDTTAINNAKSSGNEIGATLDLSLSNVIETVTGENAWETPVTELENDMTVSLELDYQTGGNSNYEVIRVHDGVTEKLDASDVSYNNVTHTLTFETDKYSTYAIAYRVNTNKSGLVVNGGQNASIYAGNKSNTKKLTASIAGKNLTSGVRWSSSNTNVATVSSNGTVTSKSVGTATITASVDGYASKSITVTVKSPVTGSLNSSYTIYAGTKSNTVTLKPAAISGSTYSWSSSDTGIAKVSSTTGKVTSVKPGTATITVKVNGYTYKKVTITVKSPVKSSLKNSYTIYTGNKSNAVTLKPDAISGSTYSWTSSDSKVAKVNSKTGKVTAVKAGTATITVKVNGYTYKKIKITVSNPTVTIKNGKKAVTSLSIKKGASKNLTVTTNPSGSTVTLTKLTDAQKKIATVSYKDGKLTVKGKSKGTIKIKLNCGGTTKTFTITVK